jgi:predicted MPP superfamily phosphohydrolase
LKRLFWKHFFRLLLFAVAVAEWVCVTWLLRGLTGLATPAWASFAGPAAIYTVNTAILRSPQPRGRLGLSLRRAYTGFAFSCVYGLLFLVVTVLGARLARAAMTLPAVPSVPAERLAAAVTAFGTGGLLLIGAVMLHGYTRGQRRVWIHRFEVELPALPGALDGFRVVQLSDIHLGPFMTAESIAEHVARVNALRPDLIVITGDITDGLDHAPATFPALARLSAPAGVLAILGNHDVATGTSAVKAALRRYTGFIVLDDENHVLVRGTSRLWVVGLMDRGLDWARGLRRCPRLERLVAQVPAAEPAIVLSHRPDLFPHAVELGCSLVLSGHTHGGQLGVPWMPGRVATLARFMTRWPRGTYRVGSSVLHVNLGLGMTGQPVRVATPREITVITLRAPRARALPFGSEATTTLKP